MKIKRTVEMNLWELIKWAFENNIHSRTIGSNNNNGIHFNADGSIYLANQLHKADLFTITEEVEVKNDTVFDELVIIQTKHFDNHDNKIVCRVVNKSIAELKKTNRTTLHEVWTMKANGIGELIWDKERGLID